MLTYLLNLMGFSYQQCRYKKTYKIIPFDLFYKISALVKDFYYSLASLTE